MLLWFGVHFYFYLIPFFFISCNHYFDFGVFVYTPPPPPPHYVLYNLHVLQKQCVLHSFHIINNSLWLVRCPVQLFLPTVLNYLYFCFDFPDAHCLHHSSRFQTSSLDLIICTGIVPLHVLCFNYPSLNHFLLTFHSF